jgi:catechol 2,3-dioxygenase-like lactoylglutathione lyase family enzyme
VDMRVEVVVIPVSDVDRSKAFYEKAGFTLDVDHKMGDTFRVVQFTPPGSACSITFGTGLGHDMVPGSIRGIHLVVDDIVAAHKELSEAGIEVADVFHFENGQRTPGPDPERNKFNSFSDFADPDGNTFVLQEVP